MAKAAILGFGTVGSGVLEVLQTNHREIAQRAGEPIQVKYVLVRKQREEPASPEQPAFLLDFETILNDPEIVLVAECIGGIGAAYRYVKACLERGKSVCTPNKELVAVYGAELLALAREKHCAFLFEAAVGSGTPLIAPLYQSLSANRIDAICGIVNGTTNFMLTKMEREQMDFSQVLQLAQEKGYAETVDPGDDVDGRDACRKIAILASMLCGRQIPPQIIPTRGIRSLTQWDMQAARQLGCAVKLIAWAEQDAQHQVSAGVEPMMIPKQHPLASVDDVYNMVLARGNMLGDTAFYGRGAGKLPTASAVVSDLLDALLYGSAVHARLFWLPAEPDVQLRTEPVPAAYYVRAEGISSQQLQRLLPGQEIPVEKGCACFVESCTEERLAQASKAAQAMGGSFACVLRQMAL